MVVLVVGVAGCGSDAAGPAASDGGGGSDIDGGGDPPDAGDGPVPDGGIEHDATPPDTTPPLAVDDLAAATAGHDSITLTWTAPSDPPGVDVASYELRWSTADITTVEEFEAGTAVPLSAPLAAGSPEMVTVDDLDPATTYYFAIRSRDDADNPSPLSNVDSAATEARAALLLSEVAMSNAAGADFIELTATAAGTVNGIEVRQSGSPTLLHTFGDLDVAIGDRLLVTLPDTGLATTDALVSVVDGGATVDALAYSSRDGDAAAASMDAFAAARAAGQWTFTAAPVNGVNDCETQREAVGISTSFGDGSCGRFATGAGAGVSLNRLGTADTDTKRDWHVAAETPGAANTPLATATILEVIATSSTTVDIRFDQELDAATVTTPSFTGTGVTVQDAVLGDVSYVTLTTTAQDGPHTIDIDPAVETIYAVGTGGTVRFCGYQPLGGLLALTEVGPAIVGADLVELQATRAGLVGHLSVRRDPQAATAGTLVANFPADLCVAEDDIVVVHLQPEALPAMPSETLAKDEVPAETESTYYDGAWDVRGGSGGLPNTDGVIAIQDTDADVYVDAMAYSSNDGTATTSYAASLAFVQGLGLWLPEDCGGAACTDASTPTAQAVAAATAGIGTTATGDSLVRASPGSTREAASWPVDPGSFGAANQP